MWNKKLFMAIFTLLFLWVLILIFINLCMVKGLIIISLNIIYSYLWAAYENIHFNKTVLTDDCLKKIFWNMSVLKASFIIDWRYVLVS